MLVILRRCIMYCIHIVVDVLAFRVKTVYTVYIVIYIYIYIDINLYVYRFCWLKLLRMYRHSFARRVQKMYARACARKSQFLAANSNFFYKCAQFYSCSNFFYNCARHCAHSSDLHKAIYMRMTYVFLVLYSIVSLSLMQYLQNL